MTDLGPTNTAVASDDQTRQPVTRQRTAMRWMQRLADETTTADTAEDVEIAPPRHGLAGAVLLLVFGLIWLGATMWGAHASIVGNASDAAVALGSAAGSLPVVVAASLLAGAAAGLTAAGWYGRSATSRLLWGALGGAVLGVLAAAAILFGYGANPSVTTLAVTVGAAGLVGGSAAALPVPILTAGLSGTFAVFLTGVAFNYFQAPLTSLLGAGDTLASRATAVTLFAYIQSTVCGLVAGMVGYLVLRRLASVAWPAYVLVGGMAGVLLLVAEGLTRLGGASLMSLVKNLSPADRAVVEYSDSARLRNALVIAFIGAIVAMILVGRTLKPASDGADEDASDDEAQAS